MKKTLIFALMLCFFAFYGCKKKEEPVGEVIVTDLPTITDIDYARIKEENKGKVILVNFFASWCPPCVAETPDFVKTYEEYKDKNFIIIGISADDDKKEAIKFVNKHGMRYPVYLSDKDIEKKYMVSKYPTTYVYDKEGKLVDMVNGMVDSAYLKSVAEMGGAE